MAPQTLTEAEWNGLPLPHNLADAHARPAQPLFAPDRLIDLLARAASIANEAIQQDLEDRFNRGLDRFTGEGRAGPGTPALLLPSASCAIDIVAKYLVAEHRTRVGLLEPCFDNIPLLLARAGLSLKPVPEDVGEIVERVDSGEMDVLFVVLPNNPTGWSMEMAELQELGTACAESRTLLIVDASFSPQQGLCPLAQIFAPTGCEYVLIDDSGKTWPSFELKVARLTSSCGRITSALRRIAEELILSVSPVSIAFLAALLELDNPEVPFAGVLAHRNRQQLRHELPSGLSVVSLHSTISVELIRVEAIPQPALFERLSRVGVAVLPARRFYWASHAGTSMMRIALYRDPGYFDAAVGRLAEASLREGRGAGA